MQRTTTRWRERRHSQELLTLYNVQRCSPKWSAGMLLIICEENAPVEEVTTEGDNTADSCLAEGPTNNRKNPVRLDAKEWFLDYVLLKRW